MSEWRTIDSAPDGVTLTLAARTRAEDVTFTEWSFAHWTDIGPKNRGSAISVNPNYFDPPVSK